MVQLQALQRPIRPREEAVHAWKASFRVESLPGIHDRDGESGLARYLGQRLGYVYRAHEHQAERCIVHLQEEAAVWGVHLLRTVVQERGTGRFVLRARLQRVKEALLPGVQVRGQDDGSLVAPILLELAQELGLHSTLST